MSVHTALEELARFRAHHKRASQEVFEKGILVLQRNGHKKTGDEGLPYQSPELIHLLTSLTGWDFLEQLALAAIDIGRLDVADVRIVSGWSVWTQLNTCRISGVWNSCQVNFLAPPESIVSQESGWKPQSRLRQPSNITGTCLKRILQTPSVLLLVLTRDD